MRRKLGWTGVGRRARLAGFLLPFAAAFLLSAPGQGQQIPNISPDQIQQLQRQFGQQGQGGISTTQPAVPPALTLQPADRDDNTALPPSRLEQIMSARAAARLRQFGYDQFGRGSSVTVPQTGAVQDEYILGPGDEVVISLRGQENSEFRATVDRSGQVVLPRLNPVSATGRDFGSFRQDIQAAVHRAYVATDAFVTIGRTRQISVLVSGEVNAPGQRLLTGLSSAADALLLSGGVKKTGSLRAVRIQRGGRDYVVDLYNLLTDRGGAGSMRLADGDRILVPPLGRTVAVTGLVRQPGIFELAPGQSAIPVRTLLSLAGGQEVRGNYRLSVLRIMPDGHSELVSVTGQAGTIRDSEILFVQLGADLTTSQATLSGGTGLAGQYAITGGSRMSDVIRAPGALGPAPYTLLGIISRQNPRNLLRELVGFTPVAVLTGGEDQVLQTSDVIRPISVSELSVLTRAVCFYQRSQLQLQEAQRNPLGQEVSNFGKTTDSFKTSSDIATDQTAQDCSQPDAPASVVRYSSPTGVTTAVQRPVVDQFGDPLSELSLPPPLPQQLQAQPLNMPETALAAGAGANPNMPQVDRPDEPRQPQMQPEHSDQPSRDGNPLNYQEQPVRPGQFASNREVKRFSDLARQLGVTENVLVNFLIDHQVMMRGALRGPGTYFVGPNAELQDLLQAAGGALNWADTSAVEVTSTVVDTAGGRSVTQRTLLSQTAGTLAGYRVRPHDEIRFNAVFTQNDAGSVTLQGEVQHTGDYQITRGERLSELLKRAGGLTGGAYPYGTVFLRKSVANAEHEGYQRAAREIEDQLVVAMTRIGTDKISPDTFTAMQAFVTDLRNQKAVGRISIAADPAVLAAKPQLDPLLEAGDLIYIPQRPSTVTILGEVMAPGSHPWLPGMSLEGYIQQAGGYKHTADESESYVILPDGSARRMQKSWLRFDSNALPPGSAIVVPRDVTSLDLRQTVIDVSQIFSQFAVSIASIAVLSRQ